MRRQDEYRLQVVIADALAKVLDPQQCFWRSSLDGARLHIVTAARHRRVNAVVKGWPDIAFYPRNGRPFFCELKRSAKIKPGADQLALHEYLRGLGYPVYVAATLDDVLAALEKQGVPTRIARAAA